MITPICRLAVDKQMVLDLVIMIRLALIVASTKLSFYINRRKITRILKTNTLMITESCII